MLKPEERFFAPSGSIPVLGPTTWHIMDWDQRRVISVTMDGELESEEPAIEQPQKHIDDLAPDVFEIRVSPEGDVVSSSTDPKDDYTMYPYRAPLEETQHPDGVQVALRSELEELDRLGPLVDLVQCLTSSEPRKKLVFKYFVIPQRSDFVWHEMNLWMRLPKHPNIVPFDKIIVDELENRCVGFTTTYIPGGTLEANKNRVFKIKWLHQLLDVVDQLNLNHGIEHQDIAPRNLLIDDATDSLMIFDFNFSSRIGLGRHQPARNDVKGTIFTMYEIITGDDTLRSVRHEEQHLEQIEEQDWVQHPEVRLDRPVSEFQDALRTWCDKRRTSQQITTYTDAPDHLEWPDTPQAPPSEYTIFYSSGPVTEIRSVQQMTRRNMDYHGRTILKWQRPA